MIWETCLISPLYLTFATVIHPCVLYSYPSELYLIIRSPFMRNNMVPIEFNDLKRDWSSLEWDVLVN